jgi:hypothetical protein
MAGLGIEGPTRVSLGKNSRIAVGGGVGNLANAAFIRYVTGSVDDSAPSQDASDNMSGGFVERTRNNRALSVTFDFLWRQADNPLSVGNGPVFDPGSEGLRMIIWPDFVNDQGQYYKIPLPYCEGASVVAVGNGDVRGSVRISSQGTYYTPSRPDPGGVFA